jgi:hypothetical protein
MKQVKFTQTYPPYNANEIALFDDTLAERLVAQGVASPVGFTPNPLVGAEELRQFRAGSSSAAARQHAAGFHHTA